MLHGSIVVTILGPFHHHQLNRTAKNHSHPRLQSYGRCTVEADQMVDSPMVRDD